MNVLRIKKITSSNVVDIGKDISQYDVYSLRNKEQEYFQHLLISCMKISRCDSENCRALLSRYDAPPAIDVANEESSSLQVKIYS